jgi:hypothetical protein
MPNSLAYLTEPRDWHGRWTAGDAGTPPDRADIVKATYTIVAELPANRRMKMSSSLHYGGSEALVNLLQAMTGIGTAHADTFKAKLQDGGMSETAASHMVDAASSLRAPSSPENAKRAQASVAAAVGDIDSDNLSRTLNGARNEVERAAGEKKPADDQGEQIPANLQPLVMPDPASYRGQTFKGAYGAQCVAFIQAVLPNAGLTSSWIMGPAVTEKTPPGTVVAAFNTSPKNI